MQKFLLIFLGGGFGSFLRFYLGNLFLKNANNQQFPFPTLLINVLGCFVIGIFGFAFGKTDNPLKYLLMIGFCGGFTTFSTFSAENFQMLQNQRYDLLIYYILASVILGILAVILGNYLAKFIFTV